MAEQLPKEQRFHSFRVIPTTPEVWAVLRARHGSQMAVFSSFSDPDGTFNGGPGIEGRMETVYGIKGADFPLLAARSLYNINWKPDGTIKSRTDDRHEYFLVLPEKESE